MSRVFVKRLTNQSIEENDVLEAFGWLQWERIVPLNSRVFIKPNLTWPEHLPGVTSTPEAIEAVIKSLKLRTSNIIVGESDGGYHSFKAEEAFIGHRLYEFTDKYGIQLVNLSKDVTETVTGKIAGKVVSISLPRILLHDMDVFITLPVPKTHVMTGVSLAFKNQWGCLPSTMRLMEHPEFDRKIIAINKVLKPKLAIMDGTYFLNGAGPMTGEAIRKDLLIVGDDAGATSLITCEIMGIDANKIRHFRTAKMEHMFPLALTEVELNRSLDEFKDHPFRMQRAFLDWISLLGFRNPFFLKLFWISSTAGPLHRLLSTARRIPAIERLLYGKVGSPPEWGKSDQKA